MAICASVSLVVNQRVRRPLAIRDRRRCEWRAMAALHRNVAKSILFRRRFHCKRIFRRLTTKPGRWREEQRPGYTEVSLKFDGLGMDDDFYKQHAQRVRDLADKGDPFSRKRLLDLADKSAAKTGKPGRRCRSLRQHQRERP